MEYLTPYTLSQIAGVSTLLISSLGAIIAFHHFFFFRRSNSSLARKVKMVFLTDAGIYLVTAIFGIWAFFEWSFGSAIALQYVRIPILLINIWASYRLFTHYKRMK